jgi:lipopolysaccharide transport system ATP-binding protein
MSDVIIQADQLCKSYMIGLSGPRERYTALREVVSRQARDLVAGARRRLRGEPRAVPSEAEEFWALRDVSFEVKRGEAVGIIGRNGAGKSTLLKILSRITEATAGRVRLRGRVASLLEVGTGFHPELTGRENIYLNGAILGMTRAEIRRKFDEIVAFAEVEKFLGTPVKRYSSGMYVRLAFAVAAHLEPEILVVDEVLAVGDMEFQKRCLGKMGDFAREGRTVLFVSHNMAAVKKLCTRGIELDAGRVVYVGSAIDAVNEYADRRSSALDLSKSWTIADAPGNDMVRLLDIRVQPASGSTLDTDSGIVIRWTFQNLCEGANLGSTVEIRTLDDTLMIHDGVRVIDWHDPLAATYEAEMRLPAILNAGRYKIGLLFGHNERYLVFRADDVLTFDLPFKEYASRLTPTPGLIRPGAASRVHLVETVACP